MIKQIRKKLKSIFDSIRNERLKINFLQALPFWIASLITGLIAVLYAKMFAYAEKGTHFIIQHHIWWLLLITPACFVVAWWIVVRFAPYARGSGIPQVIAAIDLATPRYMNKVNKLLSIRIIIVKIFSTLVMVLGGGVIGREGPTIQMAGSVFRKIHSLLPDWWPKISRKNMIMTGAAAGLAAAFNTPLGGIVFAVEELTKTHINYFKTAIFTAVIIAGLTAQGFLGPYLYLGYPDVSHLAWYIFLVVIVISVIACLGGAIMAKCILLLLRWKNNFKANYLHVIYIVVCGLIIAIIACLIDQRTLGSGKEIMTQTLFTHDKHLPWYMALLRSTGPILSFTTQGAGGVFAPSLSAGASVGSVISGWLHLSDTNTDLAILVGMVAFLTGVTRSPFTSAILVLEMTDRHNLIFQLMLAAMVASIVAWVIDRHSFYDRLKVQYIHALHHEDEIPVVQPVAV